MTRDTLVERLERARETERKTRKTHNEARIVYFATHDKFQTCLEAMLAAHDKLVEWDEDHHDEG